MLYRSSSSSSSVRTKPSIIGSMVSILLFFVIALVTLLLPVGNVNCYEEQTSTASKTVSKTIIKGNHNNIYADDSHIRRQGTIRQSIVQETKSKGYNLLSTHTSILEEEENDEDVKQSKDVVGYRQLLVGEKKSNNRRISTDDTNVKNNNSTNNNNSSNVKKKKDDPGVTIIISEASMLLCSYSKKSPCWGIPICRDNVTMCVNEETILKTDTCGSCKISTTDNNNNNNNTNSGNNNNGTSTSSGMDSVGGSTINGTTGTIEETIDDVDGDNRTSGLGTIVGTLFVPGNSIPQVIIGEPVIIATNSTPSTTPVGNTTTIVATGEREPIITPPPPSPSPPLVENTTSTVDKVTLEVSNITFIDP